MHTSMSLKSTIAPTALIVMVVALTFAPLSAAAAIVPCGTTANPEKCTFQHLVQLVVNIFNLMLGLAGFVAILFIIIAGIRMIWWNFWEESESELSSAKLTLWRAITGLVIIATAYLLINTLIYVLSGGAKNIGSILQGAGF